MQAGSMSLAGFRRSTGSPCGAKNRTARTRKRFFQQPATESVPRGGGLAARPFSVLIILAVSGATNPPAIEVEALVKTYGEVDAVRGVSFTVARGEVFGFLGPNGAGKSTTINMLCTLARPTSGAARVNGYDVTTGRDDARGLMHSPRVLFLDEPTIGLDPQTRSSIWGYIRALHEAEGTTIFMTTHYMDEAEFCDRIAIIDRGEIVVLDTPETLRASVGTDRVVLGTGDDAGALAALRDRFGIEATVAEGAVTFHVASGEAFVPRLFAELGVDITSVAVSRPTLDDVFMRYTGSTIRDAEAAPASDLNRQMLRALTKGGR